MRYPDDFINQIICGDCLETMKGMPDNCIDTIITDPPYGLSFMGKNWDSFKNSRIAKSQVVKNLGTGMRQTTLQENINFMEWTSMWAREALRILKPGGTMLCFAGSRTQHLVAFGIELAGWILKDCIMFMYGSGFPKATDISKQIDKNPNVVLANQMRDKLNEYRIKKGLSIKQINEHFRFATTGSGVAHHWMTHPTQPTIPTEEQYRKLKKLLEINDKDLDKLYIEAEREITGRDKNWGKKGSVPISGYKEFELKNQPTTEQATLWNGWKSHGLKPAYEPIIVAMKPNEGSYANNALKWGVAGLNIDGGRIGRETINVHNAPKGTFAGGEQDRGSIKNYRDHKGRFPANIILECTCDEVIEGEVETAGWKDKDKHKGENGVVNNFGATGITGKHYGVNGKEKTLIHTDPNCPCYMLDEQSGECKTGGRKIKTDCGKSWYKQNVNVRLPQDNGSGASRFFYCAKASKAERNRGCEGLPQKDYEKRKDPSKMIWCKKCNHYIDPNRKIKGNCCCENPEPFYKEIKFKPSANHHPTVKPLALMKYLCTLTKTPTGGIVFDPFCGSGTTLIACKELKRDYIGIDNIPEYCEIARRRVNATSEPLF